MRGNRWRKEREGERGGQICGGVRREENRERDEGKQMKRNRWRNRKKSNGRGEGGNQ